VQEASVAASQSSDATANSSEKNIKDGDASKKLLIFHSVPSVLHFHCISPMQLLSPLLYLSCEASMYV